MNCKVAFGAGAGVGSALLAQVMVFMGHTALYGAIALLCMVMFGLLSVINFRQKAEKPEHADYVVSASDITTSPLAATMDPRIEEAMAQDQMLVVEDDDESDEEGRPG